MLVSFFDTCVLFSLIPHSQEAIFKFVACLRQHAALRNVADGAYWVCAYANNQHRLKDCQTLLWAMSLGEFRMVQTTGLATGWLYHTALLAGRNLCKSALNFILSRDAIIHRHRTDLGWESDAFHKDLVLFWGKHRRCPAKDSERMTTATSVLRVPFPDFPNDFTWLSRWKNAMLGCPCSWMWLRLILPTRPKKPTGLNAAGCIPRTSSGLKFQPETEFRLNGVSGKQTACGLISIFEQFLPSLDGKTTDT